MSTFGTFEYILMMTRIYFYLSKIGNSGLLLVTCSLSISSRGAATFTTVKDLSTSQDAVCFFGLV